MRRHGGNVPGRSGSPAVALRDRGLDPAACTWFSQELDSVLAAGCAVNMIVWGMGPRALVACGDTLAEGDLWTRAVERQRAIYEHRNRLVQVGDIAAAVGKAQALISLAETGARAA